MRPGRASADSSTPQRRTLLLTLYLLLLICHRFASLGSVPASISPFADLPLNISFKSYPLLAPLYDGALLCESRIVSTLHLYKLMQKYTELILSIFVNFGKL